MAISERQSEPFGCDARWHEPITCWSPSLRNTLDLSSISLREATFSILSNLFSTQIAARSNHVEIVKLLIQEGADVNAPDEDGECVLKPP